MSTTSTCWPGSKLWSLSRVRADQISPELDTAAGGVDPFQHDGLTAFQRVDAGGVLALARAMSGGDRAHDGDERHRDHDEDQYLGDDATAEGRYDRGGHRSDGEHPEFGHRGQDERDAQSHRADQPPHPRVDVHMVIVGP